MDITRFLQEGSKFMAADRPDLWDQAEAFEKLVAMFSYLLDLEESGEVATGGIVLQKFFDEENDSVSWHLHRKILEFEIFQDESETALIDWTDESSLCNIGLDIPDQSFDIDD